MRDFKPLQRARDQPRQGPAARKNHAHPRAFLICQITSALSCDRFGLFGKVCANQKIETFCRFRASAHFHSLKSESPSGVIAVALDTRWASPQTSSHEPIQQRSTSEKFSLGSSSTIVAFFARSTALRRRNHSAHCAPSNPVISTWENSRLQRVGCCKRLRSLSPRSQNRIFSTARKNVEPLA